MIGVIFYVVVCKEEIEIFYWKIYMEGYDI